MLQLITFFTFFLLFSSFVFTGSADKDEGNEASSSKFLSANMLHWALWCVIVSHIILYSGSDRHILNPCEYFFLLHSGLFFLQRFSLWHVSITDDVGYYCTSLISVSQSWIHINLIVASCYTLINVIIVTFLFWFWLFYYFPNKYQISGFLFLEVLITFNWFKLQIESKYLSGVCPLHISVY